MWADYTVFMRYVCSCCALWVLFVFTAHGAEYTICKKADTAKSDIPLTCGSNQMIHVISESWGERTSEDNCSVMLKDSTAKFYKSGSQGLVVNCNGQENCTEQTNCAIDGTQGACNLSRPAAEVNYECVQGSEDICKEFSHNDHVPSIYLHSPGYPNSVGVNDSCSCRVSGSSLEVLVIEYWPRQGVVQINATGEETTSWTGFFIHFNRIITSDAVEITLSYNNGGKDDQHIWIRVRGKIRKSSCWKAMLESTKTTAKLTDTSTGSTEETTVSTTSSTSHSPRSTSGEGSATEGTPKLIDVRTGSTEETTVDNIIVVASVLGVIIFLLLLINVLQFVYIKIIKPKRTKMKTTETSGRLAENPIQDVNENIPAPSNNTYSELSRYQNTGDEDRYGRLHLYGNTST